MKYLTLFLFLCACNLSDNGTVKSDTSLTERDQDSRKDVADRDLSSDVNKKVDLATVDVGPTDVRTDIEDVQDVGQECSANVICPADKPRCENGRCETCVADNDCPVGVCVEDACVACGTDNDCTADAPVCVGQVCVECATDSHCPGTENCVNEVCSPCRSDGECSGGKRCNSLGQCRGGLKNQCGSCIGDANCKLNFHCIAMTYENQSHGSFCLEAKPIISSCPAKYKTSIVRGSVDGAPPERHCGIRESLTTCEAVSNQRTCGDGDVTLCEVGARCERIAGVNSPYICTYLCDNTSQCGQNLFCSIYCRGN